MNDNLKRIQKDIDEMNKTFSFDREPEPEPEPKTDPPATDPPMDDKTEPPTTDEPDVKTDPPTTDEPKTEPPSTDPPKDEKDEIIENLRKELADKDDDPEPKTSPPSTNAPLEFEPQDFVGDLDVEDMSKEDFNKLLNSVYQKGVTYSKDLSGPELAKQVSQLVPVISALQNATKEFYKENEDLVPYKKDAGKIWADLAQSDPSKTYDQLFSETETKLREKYSLKKPDKKTVDKGNPPRLPRKRGKSGKDIKEPKPDPLQSEFEEMNKALRR